LIFSIHNKRNYSSRQYSFTLVELLIVASVIAVLVSLLAGSLRRSIFESRKVSCSVKQKGILHAIFMYSEDNLDHYPTRNNTTGIASGYRNVSPGGGLNALPKYLDFDSYNTQYSIAGNKEFQCPQGVLEMPENPPYNNRFCYAGYYDFYFNFNMGNNSKIMRRLGDFNGWYQGSDTYTQTNVVTSDYISDRRFRNTKIGDVTTLSTNHIWGGERVYNWTQANGYTYAWANAPLHFGTITGIGTVLYGFDDGAVKAGPSLNYQMYKGKKIYPGRHGTGSPAQIPNDFIELYEQ
jgi:type II secretory pathway pseudopilin PulG